MRGLCVLGVVLFHSFPTYIHHGYLGVDAFFVISGYLMAQLYGQIRTKGEIKNFYVNRLVRLLPAYAFMVVITFFIGTLVLLPHELAVFNEDIRWSIFLLPNLGYWTDSQYWGSAEFRPLLNLWSLGVELQFYLLFPLVAKFFKSTRLLAGVAFLNFLAYVAITFLSEKSSFFLMPFRFWEFAIGILAFRFSISRDRRISRNIGMFWIFQVCVFLILKNSFQNAWVGIVAFSVGAFLSLPSKQNYKPKILKPLKVIGDYSYSIYLIHYPLLAFIYYRPFESNSKIEASTDISKLLVFVILLFLFSYALRVLVERKLSPDWKFHRVMFASASLVLTATFIPFTSIKALTLEENQTTISKSVLDYAPFRCGKVFRFLDPLGKACLLNEPSNSTKSYLLIGDSHADMLKSPLIKFADEQNVELWLWRKNESVSAHSYSEILRSVRSGKFQRVLVTSNYGGTDFGLLNRLMQESKSSPISWVYIDSIPTYPISIPQALFQRDRDINQTLLLTRSEFLASRIEELRFIESHGTDLNFKNVSLTNYLCPEHCLFERDGLPIYADSNHLTQTEVSRLSRLLEPAITG